MNAILYRGRIFRPRPDAEILAMTAQWLADAHLIGRLTLPLDVCVDGLRRNIAETLRLLRKATITEPEDYRTALLQDLAKARGQLAECEAARDRLVADHGGGGERVTAVCPACRCPTDAARLHDGRQLVLKHEVIATRRMTSAPTSIVCAGSAAIVHGGQSRDDKKQETAL